MSLSQLQAYLVARETLRRVKGSPRPCFARDPSTPPDGGGTSPPPRWALSLGSMPLHAAPAAARGGGAHPTGSHRPL